MKQVIQHLLSFTATRIVLALALFVPFLFTAIWMTGYHNATQHLGVLQLTENPPHRAQPAIRLGRSGRATDTIWIQPIFPRFRLRRRAGPHLPPSHYLARQRLYGRAGCGAVLVRALRLIFSHNETINHS